MIISDWILAIISFPLGFGLFIAIIIIFKLDKIIPDGAWPILGPFGVMGIPFLIWILAHNVLGPGKVEDQIREMKQLIKKEINFENIKAQLADQVPYIQEELKDYLLRKAVDTGDMPLLEKLLREYSELNQKKWALYAIREHIHDQLSSFEKSLWAECESSLDRNVRVVRQYRPTGNTIYIVDGKLHESTYDDVMPSELKAFKDGITSVACIKVTKEKVGTYQPSKTDALRLHYHLYLLDRHSQLIAAINEFLGGDPPKKLLYSHGASGPPPTKDKMDEWLYALPVFIKN